MIGFLKGSLILQNPNSLLVDTGGVAYEVQVSPTAFSQFQTGAIVSVWIHTVFRSDSLELYGFPSFKEKEVFLALLKVKGIGPKMALSILASCSIEQLNRMIYEENIKALSALPKVGKKTAQQIVLSLKDQISDKAIGSTDGNPGRDKLFFALEKLGFHPSEIGEALSLMKWENDLEKNLKQALSLLNPSSKS